VTSPTPDPNPPNNNSSANVPLNPMADLAVVKTAITSPVQLNGEESYTLVVTNNGPSDAVGVAVTDKLPPDLTFVSASPGCGANGTTVTCQAAALSAKTGMNTVTFRITVLVGPHSGTTVVNAATVTSQTPDPNLANNTSTATTPVLHPVLKVVKRANKRKVANGDVVRYTITVTNVGGGIAVDATLCDRLPAGTTIASRGRGHLINGRLCWTVGRLTPHHSTRRFVALRMAAASLSGDVMNVATASVLGAHTARARRMVRVVAAPPPPPGGVTG
jgi:uncharacterized repeat protein (TIGR01451 family)